MIIMCDKCKNPAAIYQRVDECKVELVITACCHGEREEMRLARYDLEHNPGMARQIDGGVGVAFRQVALLNG